MQFPEMKSDEEVKRLCLLQARALFKPTEGIYSYDVAKWEVVDDDICLRTFQARILHRIPGQKRKIVVAGLKYASERMALESLFEKLIQMAREAQDPIPQLCQRLQASEISSVAEAAGPGDVEDLVQDMSGEFKNLWTLE